VVRAAVFAAPAPPIEVGAALPRVAPRPGRQIGFVPLKDPVNCVVLPLGELPLG